MIKKEIRRLTDTTLRDGDQSPGICLTQDHKKKTGTSFWDQLGYYQIEAGIPAMGIFEKQWICEIIDQRKNAKISVWNRMNMRDIKHSFDCHPDVIHISIPVSDRLIYTMLRKGPLLGFKNHEILCFIRKRKRICCICGFSGCLQSKSGLPDFTGRSTAESAGRFDSPGGHRWNFYSFFCLPLSRQFEAAYRYLIRNSHP